MKNIPFKKCVHESKYKTKTTNFFFVDSRLGYECWAQTCAPRIILVTWLVLCSFANTLHKCFLKLPANFLFSMFSQLCLKSGQSSCRCIHCCSDVAFCACLWCPPLNCLGKEGSRSTVHMLWHALCIRGVQSEAKELSWKTKECLVSVP